LVLFIFFGMVMMLAVILSFSLSGLVILGMALLLVVATTVWHHRKTFPLNKGIARFATTTVILLALVAGIGAAVGYSDIKENVARKLSWEGEFAIRSRLQANKRGWEMFTDQWLTGWGAGCFRFDSRFIYRWLLVPSGRFATPLGSHRRFSDFMRARWVDGIWILRFSISQSSCGIDGVCIVASDYKMGQK